MKKLIILLMSLTAAFAGFAQKSKGIPKIDTTVRYTYVCPMHPEVTSDTPGKCSKCGSNLNLSKKEQLKREVVKIYTCPMHPDVTSNTDGRCSKCGMGLILSKKEQLKWETVKLTYTCPMHPEVVSDKPGKCSKCGMDLVEKKSTSDNKTPM